MSGAIISSGKPVITRKSPLLLGKAGIAREAILIDSVGAQQPNIGFTVTGQLINYPIAPVLTYAVNSGSPVAIPASQVTSTAFSVAIPGLAVGSYVVIISDGTISTTSNGFTISVAPSLTLNPIASAMAGSSVQLAGTANNYAHPPGSFDVSLDGGNTFTLTEINSPTGTAFATTISAAQAPAVGTYSVVVRDHATPSIISGAQTLIILAASGSTTPATITGIANWWDAGALGSMLNPVGAPVASWNQTVSTIADKAGATPLVASTQVLAWPRLAGQLGGAGAFVPVGSSHPPALWPLMHPDVSWSASVTLGASDEITLYLVWSRPNSTQGSGARPTPVTSFTSQTEPLISLAGTPVLTLTSNNLDTDSLILFAGASQVVLTTSITRRHTHSAIVRIKAAVGVDVWLDNTKLTASPAVNQLASLSTATLTLLGTGSAGGSAQCWFHEAAAWPHALSDADVVTLRTAASRWPRGSRKGAILIGEGQANLINQITGTNYFVQMQQAVCYLSGLLSFTVGFADGNTGSASFPYKTALGSHGIASTDGTGCLQDPGDGSDPGTWSMGTMGSTTQSYIGGWTGLDHTDIAGAYWFWSEQDSGNPYTYKPTMEKVAERWQSLVLGMIGTTSATTNVFWINALPGEGESATHGFKESVADVVSANIGFWLMNPMTADGNPNGSVYDVSTGLYSGGDGLHRDALDLINFSIRAAPVIASRLITLGRGDPGAAIPLGYPVNGGPKIASALYEGTTFAATGTILVTVKHDAGNDLIIPLLARIGIGWKFIDGITSLASLVGLTPRISVTSCVRVDATHLRLTLASLPAHGGGNQSLLYYIWEDNIAYPGGTNTNGDIGRGNAVTDNASQIVRASGSDIAADLGGSFMPNFPLAASDYGILVA